MSGRSISSWGWKVSRVIPVFAYKIGLGPLLGHMILILTTTGRKSGQTHTTPLQYEFVDGHYFIGSARGTSSDWCQNILANPEVGVHLNSIYFPATATIITDLEIITKFIKLRFTRHPVMMGILFRVQGWPAQPSPQEFQSYARQRSMVKITPK